MATCDECGVRVSTKGYLGGGIICKKCSRLKYVEKDEEALKARRVYVQRRKEKYGGAE